jgi:pyridoxine/pyridoxamine 5'-phosphate oxidase
MQNPHPLSSLDEILTSARAMLTRGAADSKDPFHWPALATVDEGGLADARTVVLRRWHFERNTLEIHSARNTAKIAQLRKNPHACLVFYHERSRIQLRAKGTVAIHHDDETTKEAWQRLSENTRKGYVGYGQFCVILLTLRDLDWLCLVPADRHQRAGFVWLDQNSLQPTAMEWRTP